MSTYISADSKLSVSQQFYEPNQFDINRNEKINFIHVKQIHGPNLPLLQAMLKDKYNITFPIALLKRATQDSQERAIRSQLKVAEAILKHPDCPVLDENLDCDITLDTIYEKKKEHEFSEKKAQFEKIFPGRELPEFDALNDIQKELLCEYGAPQVLHVLQKITAVYKSVHPEQLQAFEEQAKSGNVKQILSEQLMSAREKEAIACAREAAIMHNHSTVLVVYGALHNFKYHCREAGFSYKKIDCSFNYNILNSMSFDRVIDENLKSLVCIPNDVGFGNTLGIRCSGTGWQATVPFTWTPDGWIGNVPNDFINKFKFVVTSQDGTVTWEKLENPLSYNPNITFDGNRQRFATDYPQQVIGIVQF